MKINKKNILIVEKTVNELNKSIKYFEKIGTPVNSNKLNNMLFNNNKKRSRELEKNKYKK
ncbi:MAG: hypothetical protein AB3N34_02345 [Lettuce witches'-broom phytoplasma]